MFTHRKKIVPPKEHPSPIEDQVAQALFDLEVGTYEHKAELTELNFISAREVEIGKGKSAIITFVPFRQLKNYHRIQQSLLRELEKKFSGKHVLIIAQRRILRRPTKKEHKKHQKRPMSRTLTAVHDAILEDLVHPTEITARRTRVRLDGTKLHKVYLDKKDQNNVEAKLDTFSSVYKRLTGKDAVFEFQH